MARREVWGMAKASSDVEDRLRRVTKPCKTQPVLTKYSRTLLVGRASSSVGERGSSAWVGDRCPSFIVAVGDGIGLQTNTKWVGASSISREEFLVVIDHGGRGRKRDMF
ncbi:hypothetical protein MTO96_023965 [Rhipicephalus appendiculatus]